MTEADALSATDRALLELVYRLMGEKGSWPTFTAVDLQADRELGVEDAQAALARLPADLVSKPWPRTIFYDSDKIRLRLRGVLACAETAPDLDLLQEFIRWIVDLEQSDTSGPDTELVATSRAFAEHRGIDVQPFPAAEDELEDTALASPSTVRQGSPSTVPYEVAEGRARLTRLRALTDLLPPFWSVAGASTASPWNWQYTLDRRSLRPYRKVRNLADLLAYVESVEAQRPTDMAVPHITTVDGNVINYYGNPVPSSQPEGRTTAERDGGGLANTPAEAMANAGTELDVLLTLLRPEIAESAAELVRAGRFDDAIFAGVRRVEHELQRRVSNQQIGDPLVKYAFREAADPIRISDRSQDSERMVQLFSGAIGLLKGDRSHKDRPALPCRSRRECLRILAHASSLLDLLDRDVDRAPRVRGYEHNQGDTLTLWVERAGSQVDVWLDETVKLEKVSFRPGTLVVNVAEVPVGEHRVHLVEGTRQGAAETVWITREPGRSSWYRVVEVDIPLYADSAGRQQLDVAGLRLHALETGIISESVFPTRRSYQVGHYVDLHWTDEYLEHDAWLRDRTDRVHGLRRAWVLPHKGSFVPVFDGQPVAPAHDARLMKISIEPNRSLLRSGDKVPLRVLGHFTDGFATWSEQLDDPEVTVSDPKSVHFKGGALIAKAPGAATLRCRRSGHYTEAYVDVAAHPRGEITDYLTGLPPITGLAWTPKGLIIGNRDVNLWRAGVDGVFRPLMKIATSSPDVLGPHAIAARADGELAVSLGSIAEKILILHQSDDYRSSHWVKPEADGIPNAFSWHDDQLIVVTNTGAVCRVAPNGVTETITKVDARPVALTVQNDKVLVLCLPSLLINPDPDSAPAALWSIPLDASEPAVDLLGGQGLPDVGRVLSAGSQILLTQPRGGRILALRDGRMTVLASGLDLPGELAVSDKGEIFFAKLGSGAVHRIFA